jgi:hypothetical protein
MSQDNTEVSKDELCSLQFSNFWDIKQNTVSGFEVLAVVTEDYCLMGYNAMQSG